MNRCILQFNYYFVDRVVEERYRFLYFFLGFDNKIFLSMFLRDTTFINSSKIDLTYLDIIDAAFFSLLCDSYNINCAHFIPRQSWPCLIRQNSRLYKLVGTRFVKCEARRRFQVCAESASGLDGHVKKNFRKIRSTVHVKLVA